MPVVALAISLAAFLAAPPAPPKAFPAPPAACSIFPISPAALDTLALVEDLPPPESKSVKALKALARDITLPIRPFIIFTTGNNTFISP